jgi:hypothetical protein
MNWLTSLNMEPSQLRIINHSDKNEHSNLP